MQKMAPGPESEADRNRFVKQNVRSELERTMFKDVVDAGRVSKQVLPFCFVKIWPKDADPKCRIREAVRLFEMDQQYSQISEKIKEKVFDRERILSRLADLNNYYNYRLNERVNFKKQMLKNLHLELDQLSIANNAYRVTSLKFCRTEEEFDNHKLKFWMLHKSKNLAEEKQILRKTNVRKKKEAVSASPLDAYCLKNYSQEIHDTQLEAFKKFKGAANTIAFSNNPKKGKIWNSKSSKASIINAVKDVGDELMELRKKKRALETRIKHVDKELEAINMEIWCFQKHLKGKHQIKEATVCILQEIKIEDFWVLKCGNLEHESLHIHTILWYKSQLN